SGCLMSVGCTLLLRTLGWSSNYSPSLLRAAVDGKAFTLLIKPLSIAGLEARSTRPVPDAARVEVQNPLRVGAIVEALVLQLAVDARVQALHRDRVVEELVGAVGKGDG